jgi:hypothetical protein
MSAVGGHQFLQSLAGNPVTLNGKIELYKEAIRYLEWVAGEGFKDGKSR